MLAVSAFQGLRVIQSVGSGVGDVEGPVVGAAVQ